tara:strand:- start:1460 stop:1720 length:261 start_codon:yes stop_codon:yes gene_type:complete
VQAQTNLGRMYDVGEGVRISMDGRGRFLDNIFIERLWRSLKYECIYLHAFSGGREAARGSVTGCTSTITGARIRPMVARRRSGYIE